FESYDATTATAEKLWAELSNPSWERRRTAHVEILRRGGSVLAEATSRLADLEPEDHAAAHVPWLAAAAGSEKTRQMLSVLTRDSHPEVRLQAVRALASVSW